jgi:hypothetical protein
MILRRPDLAVESEIRPPRTRKTSRTTRRRTPTASAASSWTSDTARAGVGQSQVGNIPPPLAVSSLRRAGASRARRREEGSGAGGLKRRVRR